MILTVTLNPSVDQTMFVPTILRNDTNRVTKIERDCGGKGINVSRVITALGGKTMATGLFGGSNGKFVKEQLDREGVPNDFVKIQGETRVDISIEEESERPPTCFNAPGPEVTAHEIDLLLAKIHALLPLASWVVLGGSLPPGAPVDIYRQIGFMAREAGVPFALDADGEVLRLALEAGPTFVKPNVYEASALLDFSISELSDCLAGAHEIARMLHGDRPAERPVVVISRGSEGAVMVADGEVWVGYSPKVPCQGSLGCGDTMVAAMLDRFIKLRSPSEALQYGLAAGAATAGKIGSGLATQPEIECLLPHAHVGQICTLSSRSQAR